MLVEAEPLQAAEVLRNERFGMVQVVLPQHAQERPVQAVAQSHFPRNVQQAVRGMPHGGAQRTGLAKITRADLCAGALPHLSGHGAEVILLAYAVTNQVSYLLGEFDEPGLLCHNGQLHQKIRQSLCKNEMAQRF